MHDRSLTLRQLDDQGLLRQLVTIEQVQGPLVRLQGRWVVNWCSNDYLGLSRHPALVQAAAEAAAEWGVGAGGSRLLSGTTRWHAELEARLAAWFGAEDAIVYPSGYHANLGTLETMLSRDDAVIVDRLAHASLIDAARATKAAFRVFHHNDPQHARQVLARSASAKRRVIVTEGVFSMEGDSPPLADLLEAAEAHDALLYCDDAHGAFVLGEQGRGTPEAQHVPHARLLYMGTLGKALGCQGGFVVGPKTVADYARNAARTFIYTTAPAVPVVAAAAAALGVLGREPEHRRRVQRQAARLHAGLAAAGIPVSASASHVVPIPVGATTRAVQLSTALWTRGHWARAIRPPTVPEGAARLRIGVTALHTDEQIDQLVEALTHELTRCNG
ncbi:MAG: 8-amino-7-oxononanoate synthase [Candidatus Omnitrophica bacterium]|nr:8-amino-7-oxononanoate synthase [Candidatus Omnitrophota bacterium]